MILLPILTFFNIETEKPNIAIRQIIVKAVNLMKLAHSTALRIGFELALFWLKLGLFLALLALNWV